jgi:hypothetical protein
VVGAVLTVAAAGVQAWLGLIALERQHPVAFGAAAAFLVAAVVAVSGMWLGLSRPPARLAPDEAASALTCPRCGQPYVRRRDGGLTGLLVSLGRRAYFCQLCSHRFIGPASAALAGDQGDHREHMRLAARLPVRCLAPEGITEATVMDISMGGCRLETDAPLADGAVIFLELGAAERGNAVAVEATVLRSAGPRAFAVRFEAPGDPVDRERFRWFVQRLLAAPPGS